MSLELKQVVLRVQNRDENIQFFQYHLGFKLIMEENSTAEFSDYGMGTSHFMIEESPAYRTRSVIGAKKLSRLSLFIPHSNEVLQLLLRANKLEAVYQGENGYAFETLSPEGYRFLVHSEDDITGLKEITCPTIQEDSEFKGLTEFRISHIQLNVQSIEESRAFYKAILPESLEEQFSFIKASGDDLQHAERQTWDIANIEYQVSLSDDLRHLATTFSKQGMSVYLDKKERILVLNDPSNIEIWLVK